jgi:hypothetical protein
MLGSRRGGGFSETARRSGYELRTRRPVVTRTSLDVFVEAGPGKLDRRATGVWQANTPPRLATDTLKTYAGGSCAKREC